MSAKKPLVLVALLLLVGAAAYFGLGRSGTRAPLGEGAPDTMTSPAARALDLRKAPVAEVAHQPVTVRAERVAATPAGCRGFVTHVLALDLGKIASLLKGRDPGDADKALEAMVASLRDASQKNPCAETVGRGNFHKVQELLKNACAKPQLPPNVPAELFHARNARSCLYELQGFRIHVIAELYRDVPLDQIDDPNVLAMLMEAALRSGGAKSPDQMIEIAERLLKVAPESSDAARLAMQAYYSKMNGQAKDAPEATETRKRFGEALDRLEKMNPDDDRAAEARLSLARLEGDPDKLAEMAKSLKDQNPKSDVGPFYLAMSQSLKGDNAAAARELEDLIKRDPQNTRAVIALGAMKTYKGDFRPEDIFLDRNVAIEFDDLGNISDNMGFAGKTDETTPYADGKDPGVKVQFGIPASAGLPDFSKGPSADRKPSGGAAPSGGAPSGGAPAPGPPSVPVPAK